MSVMAGLGEGRSFSIFFIDCIPVDCGNVAICVRGRISLHSKESKRVYHLTFSWWHVFERFSHCQLRLIVLE
jgi:hypothetical protein